MSESFIKTETSLREIRPPLNTKKSFLRHLTSDDQLVSLTLRLRLFPPPVRRSQPFPPTISHPPLSPVTVPSIFTATHIKLLQHYNIDVQVWSSIALVVLQLADIEQPSEQALRNIVNSKTSNLRSVQSQLKWIIVAAEIHAATHNPFTISDPNTVPATLSALNINVVFIYTIETEQFAPSSHIPILCTLTTPMEIESDKSTDSTSIRTLINYDSITGMYSYTSNENLWLFSAPDAPLLQFVINSDETQLPFSSQPLLPHPQLHTDIISRLHDELGSTLCNAPPGPIRLENLAYIANARLCALLRIYTDVCKSVTATVPWMPMRIIGCEPQQFLRQTILNRWLGALWIPDDTLIQQSKSRDDDGKTRMESLLFHEATSRYAAMLACGFLRRRVSWFPTWLAYMETTLVTLRIAALDMSAEKVMEMMLDSEAYLHTYLAQKRMEYTVAAPAYWTEPHRVLVSRRFHELKVTSETTTAEQCVKYTWSPHGEYPYPTNISSQPHGKAVLLMHGMAAKTPNAAISLVESVSGMHKTNSNQIKLVSIPVDLWMSIPWFHFGDASSYTGNSNIPFHIFTDIH